MYSSWPSKPILWNLAHWNIPLHIKVSVQTFVSVQFSCSVLSDSLQPRGLQYARLPCPSPTSGAYLNSCPSSWWCHPTISSSVIPFSFLLQSKRPASRSFSMSPFFASGGLSIGVSASASVLPLNIQDWFLFIHLLNSSGKKSETKCTRQKQNIGLLVEEWLNKYVLNIYLQYGILRSDQIRSVAQSSHSLRPHESQHARPPCPSPTPGVHSDSRPSSQWCQPAISSSVVPFSSCPQSLPASESFPMSQLFAWGGQCTGVSALASFLPKKSQGWSSKWTGWISLHSNTTVQKHQFFGAQPSSQSNSHIHTWPQEKP